MVKEKLNVHKALCELKLLDSRIEKKISQTTFSYANKNNSNIVSGIPIEKVNVGIKFDYQHIINMMRRREAIKRAIIRSNSTTTVTISGQTYTVAEAIDMKNVIIPMRQNLLRHLSSCFSLAQREAERHNSCDLKERTKDYVKEVYGEVEHYVVIDPLDSMKIIRELEYEIDNFMAEVDSALSVSNAVTEIEIEY